jgi:2-phosphosulfolactate phosphatase
MGARRERPSESFETWPTRRVHLEWGRAALDQASGRGDGIIIVDVLSFSTLVSLVTERGAAVRALAPDDIAELGGRAAVAERFDAHVSGQNRDDPTARFTLSPASAVRVEAGDRLVVTSLNGAMLTANAAPAAFSVVASLRNCAAVGRFAAAAVRLGMVERVTIVAAGEQWAEPAVAEERTRFAVEDWLGAGAVARSGAAAGVSLSSEAEVAARGFAASRRDLHSVLAQCVSGRELIARGFDTDVSLAAATDVDEGVPWLRADGFVERLPFGLRPATGEDRSFLFELKQATMRDYVVAAFGPLEDAVERRQFAADLAGIAVVSVEGSAVGMVEARVEGDDLYLANLQVDPALQSRGLGRRIVELLASSAHARGRALVLRVLKVNGRARQFYERLGMHVTGDLPHHWTMALPPSAGSQVVSP